MLMQDHLMNYICNISLKLRAELFIEFGSSWEDKGKLLNYSILPIHLCARGWQTGEDSESRSALGYEVHFPCSIENVISF